MVHHKTDSHNVTEILLKVALNTINLTLTTGDCQLYIILYSIEQVIAWNLILFRSILLMEETVENHRPAANH
jgi:hypothetical protein